MTLIYISASLCYHCSEWILFYVIYYMIYFVECVSKIGHILSVIHYTIYQWGCVFPVYPFPLWWLREYILCLIIIIKSEVWTIIHCGLGHETMVCTVCLYSYELEWEIPSVILIYIFCAAPLCCSCSEYIYQSLSQQFHCYDIFMLITVIIFVYEINTSLQLSLFSFYYCHWCQYDCHTQYMTTVIMWKAFCKFEHWNMVYLSHNYNLCHSEMYDIDSLVIFPKVNLFVICRWLSARLK